jgi:phosphatidylglycerophosphate synthase
MRGAVEASRLDAQRSGFQGSPTAGATGVLRHVPNALTVLRLCLAPLFPICPPSWRVAVLGVALATEYLDGALSRRFGVESRFGRLVDPVADKVFFAAVALTFLGEGRIGLGALALLALRDLGVLCALAWFAARRQWRRIAGLEPALAGKATTVLQYVALFALLLTGVLHPVLLVVTAALGALAIAQYVQQQCARPAPPPPSGASA